MSFLIQKKAFGFFLFNNCREKMADKSPQDDRPPQISLSEDLWDAFASSELGYPPNSFSEQQGDDLTADVSLFGSGNFEVFDDSVWGKSFGTPSSDFPSPLNPISHGDSINQPPLKFRKTVDGGKLPAQQQTFIPSEMTHKTADLKLKQELRDDGITGHYPDLQPGESTSSLPLSSPDMAALQGYTGQPYPSAVLNVTEKEGIQIEAMNQKVQDFFEEVSINIERYDQEGRRIVLQQRELVDAWEKGSEVFHDLLSQERNTITTTGDSSISSSSSTSSTSEYGNPLRTYIEPIKQLRPSLKNEIARIQQMSEATILAPGPLDFSRNLTYRIRKILILLDLCEREIYHLGSLSELQIGPGSEEGSEGEKPNEDHLGRFVALVLKDPPLSQVMFKGKIIEETFHLSLLTAAGVKVEETGDIEAVFPAGTNVTEKAKSAKHVVSCVTEPFSAPSPPLPTTMNRGGRGNGVSSVTSFNREEKPREFVVRNVKVNISTRMAVVSLLFCLGLNGKWGKGDGKEESRGGRGKTKSSDKRKKMSFALTPDAYSIVAITNESQWMEAEYKLLVRDVYQGDDTSSEVGWCFFANCLHARFLRATKQKSSDPNRPFSPTDWNHFHEKFFGRSQVVTLDQIAAFWKWFGPIMQTLRFKKHINALWFSGLLFGIVSKEDCNRELDQQQDGTFIVRFSERYPGLFAIAFVCDDETVGGRVKHYLVRPEDTGSQKSLPDFLREKYQLKSILKYDYRKQMLQPTEKNMALKPFYSKVKAVTGVGYRCRMY